MRRSRRSGPRGLFVAARRPLRLGDLRPAAPAVRAARGHRDRDRSLTTRDSSPTRAIRETFCGHRPTGTSSPRSIRVRVGSPARQGRRRTRCSTRETAGRRRSSTVNRRGDSAAASRTLGFPELTFFLGADFVRGSGALPRTDRLIRSDAATLIRRPVTHGAPAESDLIYDWNRAGGAASPARGTRRARRRDAAGRAAVALGPKPVDREEARASCT